MMPKSAGHLIKSLYDAPDYTCSKQFADVPEGTC